MGNTLVKNILFGIFIFFTNCILSQSREISFLESNSAVLSEKKGKNLKLFHLTENDLGKNDLFIIGETHYMTGNSAITSLFFKKLFFDRYPCVIINEGGYSHEFLINLYITSGDKKILNLIIDLFGNDFYFNKTILPLLSSYNKLAPEKYLFKSVDYEAGENGSKNGTEDEIAIASLYFLTPRFIHDTLELPYLNEINKKVTETKRKYEVENNDTLFFSHLETEMNKNNVKYQTVLGQNYGKFNKIVSGMISGGDFFKNENWDSFENLSKRDIYIYNNINKLKEEYKGYKFLLQFGSMHSPKSYVNDSKTSKQWCTLACQLNTANQSLFKDKVCSFLIFYPTYDPDLGIEQEKFNEIKKWFTANNDFLLFKISNSNTPFTELSKYYDYLIFSVFSKNSAKDLRRGKQHKTSLLRKR